MCVEFGLLLGVLVEKVCLGTCLTVVCLVVVVFVGGGAVFYVKGY